MATIDLGTYQLESYPDGWMVGEKAVYTSGAQKGVSYIKRPQYAYSLGGAIQMALEMELRGSDATSLAELLQVIDTFRSQLAQRFAIRIEVG